MMRVTIVILAAIAFLCIAAANSPPVTFESPCECRDNHGQYRWSVKIDPSLPPADASAMQAVTPSDMFSWPGPNVHLTGQSKRTGIENEWYALTGRVVAVKAETDGDLHIALQDATGRLHKRSQLFIRTHNETLSSRPDERQQSRSFALWNQSLRHSPKLQPRLLRLEKSIRGNSVSAFP
jgi:hypothetical protein